MKKLMALLFVSALLLNVNAQTKYLTKTGYIKFFSHTAIEDITAEVQNVGSIIDAETGEIIVSLAMTDFDFQKKLMQEHFNENYVESDKYPKSSFKGMITNNDAINYGKKGHYKAMVKGDMTIHGVTREVEAEGSIDITDKGVVAKATFLLNPEDYEISIPNVVRNKIANDLEITVDLSYKLM